LLDKVFFSAESPPLSPPFHPHSVERLYRSVQVGCSRFSRCCHLLVDLHPIPKNGTWARRLTQSPELALGSILRISLLRSCCHYGSTAVTQRFVYFSAHPRSRDVRGCTCPTLQKNAFLVNFDQRSHARSLILTTENALNGRRDKSPLGVATSSVLISPRIRLAAAGLFAPRSNSLWPHLSADMNQPCLAVVESAAYERNR